MAQAFFEGVGAIKRNLTVEAEFEVVAQKSTRKLCQVSGAAFMSRS
jgi:hypothetical protein